MGEDREGGGGAGDGVEEVYPMRKVRVSTGVRGRGRRRGSRRHGAEVTNKNWKEGKVQKKRKNRITARGH